MTQSLVIEVAPRGIRVSCIAPGLVQTPMTYKYSPYLTQEMIVKNSACHPLGVGSPHDIAAAVAFLASEDARWITGVMLPMGWVPTMPLPVVQILISGTAR